MLEAYKFGDYLIPKLNRADPFRVSFRTASVATIRTDGAISAWGDARAPLEARTHEVSWLMRGVRGAAACANPEDALAEALALAASAGRQRLWFDTVARTGPQLYTPAYVRDINMERVPGTFASASVTCVFQLDVPFLLQPLSAAYLTRNGFTPVTLASNVFGESWDERTFARFPLTVDPTTIVIDNPGHLRTHRMILRLESLGVGGFSAPSITNETTEQSIETTMVAADANARWQANCNIGANRVRRSVDGGLNWTNDWPNTTIGDLQTPLLELAPGENTLTITGATNAYLMVLWLPAYLL